MGSRRSLLQKVRCPLSKVLKIATEVAQALAKAHQQGIIHRNLKPAESLAARAKLSSPLLFFAAARSGSNTRWPREKVLVYTM